MFSFKVKSWFKPDKSESIKLFVLKMLKEVVSWMLRLFLGRKHVESNCFLWIVWVSLNLNFGGKCFAKIFWLSLKPSFEYFMEKTNKRKTAMTSFLLFFGKHKLWVMLCMHWHNKAANRSHSYTGINHIFLGKKCSWTDVHIHCPRINPEKFLR